VLDQGEPKYLNSPETPLFSKGHELYGLFEARQAIRDAGYVLVTEGYMDVVALAQMGFPQAVATLGTACTTNHVQKLLRQTDTVIFSFDGDKAGRRAARRALEACLPHVTDNKTIKFLFLPTEHDPDSYVRAYGKEAFEQEIHEAMPLSQFLIKEAIGEHDMQPGRPRPRPVRRQAHAAGDDADRAAPADRARAGAGDDDHDVRDRIAVRTVQADRAGQIAPPKSGRPQPKGLELQIVRLLVAHPALALDVDAAALPRSSSSAPKRASWWRSGCWQFRGICAAFEVAGRRVRRIIGEIVKEPESERDTERLVLRAAIRQVKHDALKQELSQLFAAGLTSDEIGVRYRELTAQQDQLLREAQAELPGR
jgi:DNA primase